MGSNPTTDNTFLRKKKCQVFSVNIPSLPVPMPSSGRKWVTNANNSSKNHHSTPHPQVKLLVFYFYTVVIIIENIIFCLWLCLITQVSMPSNRDLFGPESLNEFNRATRFVYHCIETTWQNIPKRHYVLRL